MNLLIWSLIFIAAMAVLIKSADIFTDSSEKIGKHFGIPQFLIGMSIVTLGTSLPELTTSLIANVRGVSTIVAANVAGDVIANILLVGGLSALIAGTLLTEKNRMGHDLAILGSIVALFIVTIYDGTFSIFEGAILLCAYGIYVAYHWNQHKKAQSERSEKNLGSTNQWWLLVLISAVGIFLGSHFTIEAIIQLSGMLNISPSIIAITAVALGTSLPELLVSVKAAQRKNFDIAMGNIIGSSVFNLTVVMSIPTLLGPLSVSQDVIGIAIPFLIIAVLLFIFSSVENKFRTYEGALYCLIYFVFIGQLFHFL